MNDSQNGPFGDAEFPSQRIGTDSSRGVHGTYMQYICISKFRIRAFGSFLARRKALSPLRNFISRIISSSAKEQVFRIYARRVITFMQNAAPVRYGAHINFVANPMCQQQFASSSAEFENPVAKLYVFSTYPYPASVRCGISHGDPSVKHFFDVSAWSFHGVKVYSPVFN